LLTSAPPTTIAAASSVCSFLTTPQVAALLSVGAVTDQTTPAGCQWYASDATVNASLAVNFYPTPAMARSAFLSEQQFDPGQQPFALGDRAYTSAVAGLPRHGTAKVLVASAIVTAVANVPVPRVDAVAAAKAIVKVGDDRVRQGWRP
jgi:hypothetical protein